MKHHFPAEAVDRAQWRRTGLKCCFGRSGSKGWSGGCGGWLCAMCGPEYHFCGYRRDLRHLWIFVFVPFAGKGRPRRRAFAGNRAVGTFGKEFRFRRRIAGQLPHRRSGFRRKRRQRKFRQNPRPVRRQSDTPRGRPVSAGSRRHRTKSRGKPPFSR